MQKTYPYIINNDMISNDNIGYRESWSQFGGVRSHVFCPVTLVTLFEKVVRGLFYLIKLDTVQDRNEKLR